MTLLTLLDRIRLCWLRGEHDYRRMTKADMRFDYQRASDTRFMTCRRCSKLRAVTPRPRKGKE